MSDKPAVYVAGIGMITPLGANAEMTAAMVNAGMSAYKNSDFYLDNDEAVRMALVPQTLLDNSVNEAAVPRDFSVRQFRLLQLAKLALAQLVPLLPKDLSPPLFLAGPEQLIDGDRPIDKMFLESLAKQTGAKLDLATSRIVSTGRAGGLAAIDLAFRLFDSGDYRFALVGGVDSFYDGAILKLLLRQQRLLAGDNMDGFIPGEGATFMLLAKQPVPLRADARLVVRLYEPGQASEPGHRASAEIYRGDGLATACAAALANAPEAKIQVLYSSMNGEHFFAKEHGVAMIRHSECLADNLKIEHPADAFGDLGAAFGPTAIGIISVNLLNGRTRAPCMVCCSADKDARSACVIEGRTLAA